MRTSCPEASWDIRRRSQTVDIVTNCPPDPGGNASKVACVEVTIFLTLDEPDDVACDDPVDDDQNDAKYDVS
jgi:hypothetical protein